MIYTTRLRQSCPATPRSAARSKRGRQRASAALALAVGLLSSFATPDAQAQSAPSRSDDRRVFWTSAGDAYGQNPSAALAQVSEFPNPMLSGLSEGGFGGWGGDPSLSRTSDPVDRSRRAFKHVLKPGFAPWARGWVSSDTFRSEITAPGNNPGGTVVRGTTYWIAYAVKPDDDVLRIPGAVSLFDLHTPDGSRNIGTSPLQLLAGNGRFTLVRGWNPTYMGTTPTREVVDLPASSSQWNYLVFQVKMHWDENQSPFLRVWLATGDGMPTKVFERYGPIGYNEASPSTVEKFGIYRWDGWNGEQSHTSYTKGLFVFRDAAGDAPIDENRMLALLRSI